MLRNWSNLAKKNYVFLKSCSCLLLWHQTTTLMSHPLWFKIYPGIYNKIFQTLMVRRRTLLTASIWNWSNGPHIYYMELIHRPNQPPHTPLKEVNNVQMQCYHCIQKKGCNTWHKSVQWVSLHFPLFCVV